MEIQEKIKKMLEDKQTTRREFLTAAMALGLSLTAASTIWSNAAKAAAKAVPKSGGHLRIGMTGAATSDSLDPSTFLGVYMIAVGWAIRDNMTAIGKDGNIEPAAAESWEASPDAATWVFKLRKGVEFSNGKSLEAEDIITSMNMHRGEKSKSPAKVILEPVQEIIANDKHTVTFKLNAGNADFPFQLSAFRLNIMPSKDGEPDWQSGAGTGAYILEEFEPGVRATFRLNPNRWNQDVGFVDSAELIAISDAVARQSSLATGVVDAINRVDLKTAYMLDKNPKLRVEHVTGLQHITFPMNTQRAPFDNNDVRLALKYAIDREELLNKILRGYGKVGNDHPISPAMRYYSADIPQREYDPDKAKFHLKKAGYDSLKVGIHVADGIVLGAIDMALLYKEKAAKAGIEVNVVREPSDGFWSNVWLKKPFVISWWAGRSTEDWMFNVAYSSTSAWNDTHWQNERFNELLLMARSELDEAKRREMYREMQLMVRDEGGALIPLFNNHVFAVRNEVQFDQVDGSFELDGCKAIERWWFA